MKLRMNLLVGLFAAILAFAGVACDGDTADDDFGTDPGVETTEDFGTGTDDGLDDGATEDLGTGTETAPAP